MTSIRQSYLFSVLVAVTVLPLDASNLLTLRQSNDPAASLKKCLKHLEKQQTDVNFRSAFSSKISSNEICSNLLEHLLNNLPLLPDHHSEMQFGSGNVGAGMFSEDDAAKGVVYRNMNPWLYAKGDITKMNKNISHKLANIRNTLSEALPNHGGLDHPDISSISDDVILDKPTADFIHNVPVVMNSLKPRNSLLKKLVESDNFLPRAYYLFNNQRGNSYSDGVMNDNDAADESMPVQEEQMSSGDRSAPEKRAPNDWFHVVSTEVAKRRRQTLSINNALMALTDMVVEHGKEKLMRNRDNLRYHMYIQG